MSEIPSVQYLIQDDGFAITAAEPWIKHKVQLIQQYISAFVANLAGTVNDIFLIDLYAGNGYYSLGAKKEIFTGHGLSALGLDLPVSKVILCEKDPDEYKVLKIRVNRLYRQKNVVLLEGKPGELIDKLKLYVPQSKGNYRAGVLCICDPFSIETPFDLVDKLTMAGFSFLMPFTFALNSKVNYRYYLREGRDRMKKFMGGYRDIERLERGVNDNVQFYKRLVRIYENNVLSLGLNASNSVHKLDSGLMELPMYYVGFFSKQFPTKSIQDDVEATRNVQFELF